MSRRRFSEWCTRWGTRRNKPGQRAGRPRIASPRRQARRLLLEALEYRWTPASFLVQTSGDDISAASLAGSGTPADPFQMSSLRAAIIAANRSKGPDTIAFAPAVDGKPITLSLPNQSGVNEDAGLSGDLDVTDNLTIIGNGPTNTIIQAGTNETDGIDKVLAINPGRLDAIDFALSAQRSALAATRSRSPRKTPAPPPRASIGLEAGQEVCRSPTPSSATTRM